MIQFYSNIDEKRVGKSPQKFQRGQHSETYSLSLKKQDKTKMELPFDMVSISASSCRLLLQKKVLKLTKRNAAAAQLLEQEIALKKRGMGVMEISDKYHEKSLKNFEETSTI